MDKNSPQISRQVKAEAARRRTFAIISHPDAGKTTLTEKLLLYGGALDLAGSVAAKKKQRETASDWMELEKKRGISISSTVLQFDYENYRLNLLDTPGHKDFSEDTYRVLMAVDAVIMVIDAGKGIESQTLKLFEICRKRGIPIFTFMNKLDRPAKPPLELIDQLEKVLNLHAFPATWPLGNGPGFKGIYDRMKKEVHLFERVPGGAYIAPVSVHDLSDPFIKDMLQEQAYREVIEELGMLDGAHGGFDRNAVLQGKTTPVFFGSAGNNFGVELLLRGFLEHSSEPTPRKGKNGVIPLDHPDFSAFVFKVQTNMNPLHRDRVVFARVCSGKFCRDMTVYHARSGKNIRLSDSYNLFGREREVIHEAFPGDVIGFVTKLDYRIGDTISVDPALVFEEIPRFAPECFAFLHNKAASTYKSFRKGLDHLLAEDIVQPIFLRKTRHHTPLLGAVGPLQFEVLQYRLKDEYRAEASLEMMPWKVLRWLDPSMEIEDLEPGRVRVWTEEGEFTLPQDAKKILGAGHPFLAPLTEDLVRVCHHPNAGDFTIMGFKPDHKPMTFPVENGSHGGPGPEETNGFALLPIDIIPKRGGAGVFNAKGPAG
ncbi:MAG: peptide chain release factor 3 [Candidatus Omnitrophota bacterium]|nr:peptide chain release factor 3 [Candidatus Omnitrophota bacterium]